MKNYYEILEVHPTASYEFIKKVYKMKIKQNHPDLFQGEEKVKAEALTKKITEAYTTLSNKEKREKYDEELKKDNINIDKYVNMISALKKENEYLKQVIMSKNSIINRYINDENNLYYNNSNTNNSENIPPSQKNNYSNENKDYFNSILFDLKQLGFKLVVFFIIILTLLMFFWLLTGNNIFKVLEKLH